MVTPFMSVEDYLRRKIERVRKEQGLTLTFLAGTMGMSMYALDQFRKGLNQRGLDVDQAEQMNILLGGKPFIPRKERKETWLTSNRTYDLNAVTRLQAHKIKRAKRRKAREAAR
jgi:transcriptional regulator with XRE-family HTH domain